MCFLSPAWLILFVGTRTFEAYGSLEWIDILSLLLPALVYYTAAVLVHRKRKNEMAANAVVFHKVQTVVKFLFIFAAGTAGAVGNHQLKALIRSTGPESHLSATGMADHSHIFMVDSRVRFQIIQHSACTKGPTGNGSP